MNTSPLTKAARHAQIASILSQKSLPVRSQEELAELLNQRGVRVTQATLSRDLEELGAVRLRGADGALVYALPGEPGPGGLGESSGAALSRPSCSSVPRRAPISSYCARRLGRRSCSPRRSTTRAGRPYSAP
jgi:transcriptional regulator of arginine metabolism